VRLQECKLFDLIFLKGMSTSHQTSRKQRNFSMRKTFVSGLITPVAGIIALGAYLLVYRPWQEHWGATEEEIARPLPFDGVVPNPTWNATRAVTIAATPEQIWPFLIQIGWGRAGWYGYDLVDNGGKPSTWEILPEYQHLEVGKDFPMSPWTAMYCKAFEEPRWMLWQSTKDSAEMSSDISGTWLWYLDTVDERHTRLITRMRDTYRWTNPLILSQQIMTELGDLPFMRKCMLGIKARAERAREVALPYTSATG
jgi:hypothetical protein